MAGPKQIKRWKRGDVITHGRLNDLVNQANLGITALDGSGISYGAAGVIIDPSHVAGWGIATVDSSSQPSDFTDEHYYGQWGRLIADSTSDNAVVTVSDKTFPNSDTFIITNLAEVQTSNHLVSDSQNLLVFSFWDQNTPSKKRYVTWATPPPCFHATHDPRGSDFFPLKSDIVGSDITGNPSDADPSDFKNWLAKGYHYMESDGTVNPWVPLDLTLTHMAFAVRVTQTGGYPGTASDQCSFTYLVTDIHSEYTLGVDLSPLKTRPALGAIDAPPDNSVGLGIFGSDHTFQLYDANETLEVSDCI